jgi:hypothetical protein
MGDDEWVLFLAAGFVWQEEPHTMANMTAMRVNDPQPPETIRLPHKHKMERKQSTESGMCMVPPV